MGLLDGSYVAIARTTVPGKIVNLLNKIAFIGMQGGEYEIRGSYLLGELTKEEWKTGNITPERFREILDGIAITQGIYTKTDSPLFVQTAPGRMVVQFGRWMITDLMLVRRTIRGMKTEWRAGNKTGPNTGKLLKMLIISTLALYFGFQLAKAGFKTASKIVKAAGENINVIFNTVTGKIIYQAIADNPTLQMFGELVYSGQLLSWYLGLIQKPFPIEINKPIWDTWISALDSYGLREKKKEGIEIPSIKIPSIKIPSINIPSISI